MDISSLILIKRTDVYRQELEAIDNQSNKSKEQKVTEQIKIFRQWHEDIQKAYRTAKGTSRELKRQFNQFEEDEQKIRAKLKKFAEDVKYAKEELHHNDSGVGEVLTASESLEQRWEVLSEENSKTSREYEQFVMQLQKVEQVVTNINAHGDDLMAVCEQWQLKLQQDSNN